MNRIALKTMALLAVALGTAGIVWAEGATTPSGAIDISAMRDKALPSVCRVTIQNAWGVPLAYANGFVLGQGRFVITDLGAAAQAGAAQATLQFANGTTSVAKEFGMADPGIGLAALMVEGESSPRAGLDLVADMPSLEGGVMAATVGWGWCKDSDVVTGRLNRGPTVRDMAQRCGVEAPPTAEAFLRLDGGRLDLAAGAPVLDRQGAVLAVKLDLAAKDVAIPLAVPASSFRKTLLSAQPQLKPMTEMPKPVWPIRLLRVPGEPQSAQEFAKTVQALKAGMVCQTCDGEGVVKGEAWRRGIGKWGLGDGRPGACPTCQGTKIAYRPAVYTLFSTMVLEATRIAWSPMVDERTRSTAHASATEMLTVLTKAGILFQVGVAFAGWGDVANARKAWPRGAILYCEVAETVDGPEGKYVLLGPYNAAPSVAVRADLLTGPGGKAAASRRLPSPGDKIVLAGAALGPFKSPAQQGICVLPFEWAPAPGELPEPEPPPRGPPRR